MRGTSGSYDPRDVTFLLEPIEMAPLDRLEKERLIQSGARHYSEIIGREEKPSEAYHAAFEAAFTRNRRRYARDLLVLADLVRAQREAPVIVSLARAGTPVGVSLARILDQAPHYSISIIRDRGIDQEALRYILARHPARSLVFLDGWTAKGVIQRELERSLAGTTLSPELFVVADLSGTAAFAATGEDYVLPSAILNATISGLVSRSILSDAHHRPGDFHGCLYLAELASSDKSRWFVDEIARDVEALRGEPRTFVGDADKALRRARSAAFVARVREEHGVTDENHIKPGIAEATRVMLRRVPDRLLVRDVADDDVRHLLVLARDRAVDTIIEPDLPYKAAALIRRLS